MKERIDKILDNETKRLSEASKRGALQEKELKKLEILTKIYQILQGIGISGQVPDEIKGASTEALVRAIRSGDNKG